MAEFGTESLHRIIAFALYYFKETLNLHLFSENCLHADVHLLDITCLLLGIQNGLYERIAFSRSKVSFLQLKNSLAFWLLLSASTVGTFSIIKWPRRGRWQKDGGKGGLEKLSGVQRAK